MTTEYLALWVHFLWSGGLSMVFSLTAWWKMGALINKNTHKDGKMGSAGREAMKKRHRLLRIAIMTSFCLLVMMAALLSTSSKLDEYNRTADLSLTCFKETTFSRDFSAYGLSEKDGKVKVCNSKDVLWAQNGTCSDGCFWYPGLVTEYLACYPAGGYIALDGGSFESLEAMAAYENPESNGVWGVACDCPCTSFIEVETPRYARTPPSNTTIPPPISNP